MVYEICKSLHTVYMQILQCPNCSGIGVVYFHFSLYFPSCSQFPILLSQRDSPTPPPWSDFYFSPGLFILSISQLSELTLSSITESFILAALFHPSVPSMFSLTVSVPFLPAYVSELKNHFFLSAQVFNSTYFVCFKHNT